jgi:RND family efflux transporter MFP subunit
MNLDDVFVQIRIPSTQFAKIHKGTEIKIELASLPGQTFPGNVTRISGQADPATGNVIVFALVKNSDHLLRPGLSCQVHVSLPEVASALAIPVAAIADNSGTPVVTIIRDDKAYETEVTLGVETSDQVQILSGLKVGDQVATAGGYGLPEGCPVVIATVKP